MKNAHDRESLEGMLRDLERRLERRERHVHPEVDGYAPSADQGNHARVGSDGLVYVNKIVASATPPLPVAYGATAIPVGAVWLELGELPVSGGWCDDFERPEIGPDWTVGPVFDQGLYVTVVENALDGHAFIAGENTPPDPASVLGTIATTAEWPGDQTVEVEVGNFFQGHDPSMDEGYQWVEGELYLLTQVVGGTSQAAVGVYVIISVRPFGGGDVYAQLITVDAAGVRSYFDDASTGERPPAWETNPDYTIRLETTVEGHCKVFFEGTLLLEGDVPPTGGTHIGLVQQWNRTNYAEPDVAVPNPGTSPWFSQVCVDMPPGTIA